MRLNTNSLKRTVAVLAAVCTLGTCCIAGSIAYAQGETQGADTGNINTSTSVSLSIHKYQGPADKTRSDGSEKTITGKEPVQGVEFTLYKVQKDGQDINLATPDGWKKITSITDDAKTPSDLVKTDNSDTNTKHVFTISEVGKGKTNSQGLVKFTKTASTVDDSGEVSVSTLGMSLYVVKETNTDGAKIKGKSVTVTGRVDPFFVTLPLANSTTKTWIYDVHVYPKNDTTNLLPTKTASDISRMDVVDDKDTNTKDGTRITWKVAIPLPAPAEGKAYNAIGFSDKMSKDLTFDEVKNVKLVKYNSETGAAVEGADNTKPLTENTNYTVTKPSTDRVLKVELNASGLSEAYTFYSAAKDAKQIVKLEADVVTKVGKDVKNVKNIANTWADNNKTGDKDNPCNPDSDTPGAGCDTAPSDTSYYGTLKVIKEDTENNKRLDGAKFDVYEITDGKKKSDVKSVTKNGETYNFAGDNGAIASKKVASSLETKKVDKDNGVDSVKLFVRKESDKKTTSKTYCIVETEAPAGYDAITTPTCYDLVEDTAGTANTANVNTVKDAKSTPMSKILTALPMTGARGLVLLTAFGIVGLGGTLFYIITRRRKEQEEA
ncbi:SpaH/EbpB family LPXTG-anchored major pilin [Gardnerella vaginalis]|jgi:LPXTG-motif cell wall anchor domain protein|uniref:Putative fimbrial subunit n=1 Tax=Gardnerella vaginalis 1400E TaxID=698956 RepID=I4LUV9_GARVA|nr:SpaH/EbpB family LPXTG-anchored major pilin [Gardnerella vaginalis]EIK80749.1 putative fimbrial subunit [Gardnerella vaginalis 1400E]EPI56414.1 LPXTG-motif protein cell wall anchor domain protein [Gardnerella vaginalis JCP7275]